MVPDLTDEQWAALLVSLPEGKQRYARRFKSASRWQSFVAGHYLLQNSLAQFGFSGKTYRTSYGAAWEADSSRATTAPATESISVGISHSASFVACIVSSNGGAGIDVEMPSDRNRNIKELVNHFFSERDKSAFRDIAPDNEESMFLLRWTLKESYIKALGEGVSSARLRTNFLPISQQGSEIERDTNWKNHSFLWQQGIGAIAISSLVQQEPQFYQFSWEDKRLDLMASPMVGQWYSPSDADA